MEGILSDIFRFIFSPRELALTMFAMAVLTIAVQILILVFWKKVIGKVVKSDLACKEGKGRGLYYPSITYTYSYGGIDYSGKFGWILNETSSSKSVMQKKVDDNPVGGDVHVLVNPWKPRQSVLEREINPFHWILITMILAAGLIFVVFGGA